MPTPPVIDKVRQLQAQLGETQPNPATGPELEKLRTAVDNVMLEPDHAPHYASLRERLRGAYAGFEHEHPELASSIQQVVNALTAAGL
jgi:hypothetical protein